jgi:lysyl-tRNA synthetase class 2
MSERRADIPSPGAATQAQDDAHQDENQLIAQRRLKLTRLREREVAFPNDFRRDALAEDLIAAHGHKDADRLESEAIAVKVAGRLMSRRVMGKASFSHLQDMSGRIQLFVQRDAVGEDAYAAYKRELDLGDILGVEGILFKTKTGELSVRCNSVRLLTKSLRPLPEKWHGLSDMETRYRQRYVDLIVNASSRQTFRVRSGIIQFMREYLNRRGFLEVETPMMQVIPGGAVARPFVTHHNALDMDLYLRIAPELFLKRLVVGGFEKVYEINRNFRNEGLSTRHNPEFTMVEFYEAYADYRDLMDLTEDMMRRLAETVLGTARINYQGTELDFGAGFQRLSVRDAVVRYNEGLTEREIDDLGSARAFAKGLGIEVEADWGLGRVQVAIFEETVEERLVQPTFVTGYPTEVSPLARRSDVDAAVTERFELFIGGWEIANGFSELNDPEDQAERFQRQVAEKEAGNEEAMYYDADYIRALEHGMPPTAGEGIGIDRLAMLLTDSPSIRDVLLFPHMRPED